MLNLSAKIRKISGKKTDLLRKKGFLPAVLYGADVKNIQLEVNTKEFNGIYKEAGESSLVSLYIDDKKIPILIHEVQHNPLTEEPIHVDFYNPSMKKEIEANVPLIFEGESLAVKDLGGTLVKSISEIEVRSLAKNLPHEIKVNIDNLKTFEDSILVKDLNLPDGVTVSQNLEDTIANVAAPQKVEEELAKPIEEKVEDVEKVEEKKEESEEVEEKEKEKEENEKEKS